MKSTTMPSYVLCGERLKQVEQVFMFFISRELATLLRKKNIKFMASIACNRFSISKRLCSFVIFRAESSTKFTAWNSRRKRRGKKWSKKFFFKSSYRENEKKNVYRKSKIVFVRRVALRYHQRRKWFWILILFFFFVSIPWCHFDYENGA